VVGSVDCLAEKLAPLDAAVAATEKGAEVGQGAGMFEAGIDTGEDFDRLTQQGLATITARYEPGRSQGHAQGPRGAKGAGYFELFVAKAPRSLAFTKG
jgi:hypothetical protein